MRDQSAVNFDEVLDIFTGKSDCRSYSCVRIIIMNFLFWGFLGWEIRPLGWDIPPPPPLPPFYMKHWEGGRELEKEGGREGRRREGGEGVGGGGGGELEKEGVREGVGEGGMELEKEGGGREEKVVQKCGNHISTTMHFLQGWEVGRGG